MDGCMGGWKKKYFMLNETLGSFLSVYLLNIGSFIP